MANPFKRARVRRGWTVTDVVNRCPNVRDQQIRNLESQQTPGTRVTVRTMTELVEVFWPDLELRHFAPDTPLALKARTASDRRKLRRNGRQVRA